MFIVVEGTDGVGKTTLCHGLREQLLRRTGRQFKIVHEGPRPKGTTFIEYYTRFRYEDVIADRWHLGEVVYGTCRNKNGRLGRVLPEDTNGIAPSIDVLDKSLLKFVKHANMHVICLVATDRSELQRRLDKKTTSTIPEYDDIDEAWHYNAIFAALCMTDEVDTVLPMGSGLLNDAIVGRGTLIELPNFRRKLEVTVRDD